MSGPALAGGLVALVTAPWAVLADAVSYLVSGGLLLRISVSEPSPTKASAPGVRREAAEGPRRIYKHATLGPFALNSHGWFLCSAVASAILPAFALRTIGLSTLGYGLALSVGGIGGLVGSLAASRLGGRFGAGRVVIACRVSTAISWAVVALSWQHWLGWVLFGARQLLLGLSLGAENANEMGYWQALTPDALQGRVNATRRSINRAMIVLGGPAGGFLGDAIGYRPMLWAASGGFLVAAVALGFSTFRGARVDDRAGHLNA